MAEAVLHDCKTQKNEISDQLKTPLKKGDTWYVKCTEIRGSMVPGQAYYVCPFVKTTFVFTAYSHSTRRDRRRRQSHSHPSFLLSVWLRECSVWLIKTHRRQRVSRQNTANHHKPPHTTAERRDSVVSTSACHAGSPGSLPGPGAWHY